MSARELFGTEYADGRNGHDTPGVFVRHSGSRRDRFARTALQPPWAGDGCPRRNRRGDPRRRRLDRRLVRAHAGVCIAATIAVRRRAALAELRPSDRHHRRARSRAGQGGRSSWTATSRIPRKLRWTSPGAGGRATTSSTRFATRGRAIAQAKLDDRAGGSTACMNRLGDVPDPSGRGRLPPRRSAGPRRHDRDARTPPLPAGHVRLDRLRPDRRCTTSAKLATPVVPSSRAGA